jgi:phosphoserine phosphatase RsbU/P
MKKRKQRPRTTSPTLLRGLLVVYIVASVAYWVSGVVDNWELSLHWDRHIQSPFSYDNENLRVEDLKPEAKAAGLVEGVKITGLNGAPYNGTAQWAEILVTAHPGDTLDVEYDRPDGTHGIATLTLTQRKRAHAGIPTWAIFTRDGTLELLPLLCMLIGAWVVLAKPLDRNAWLVLCLLSFTVALTMDIGMATGAGMLLRGLWYQTLQLFAPPALLLFGVYFPERSRIDQKLPWLKWVIAGPILAFTAFLYPYLFKLYFLGGASPIWAKTSDYAGHIVNFLNLVCVIAYLILTLDKLRSASTADARRRLRVLTVGMAVGVGSLLFVFILLPHFGYKRDSTVGFWGDSAGAILFMIAPLTLAYVVLVQRAMDVRVILRAGTRYLLAKAFLVVLQFVLVFVAGLRLLLPVLHKKEPTSLDIAGAFVFVGIVLALRFGVRKRAQAWLDRKFFREAYNAEQVLNELSDEVRRFTETEPLLETVARRVADTLHVNQVAMLLRRGEFFQLQQSIGISSAGMLALPSQASAIRYLTSTNEPARLYREDPDAWYLMAGTAERSVLDMVNAELLLPLPGRNRLMGLMALGPKRSEAAYTQADLHMLQTVATQTGLAIEVAELAHSLADEAAQRERVNREIEIAREVQERLFPQTMPDLEGATIAGHCRPALGVGGDYYDVFELSDGRTGIAIGDVSGKGIAAALLMASLRASLRGVTLDNPREFAKLMDKVNRLVYEASASNRYATFFFAAYDPKTRQLDCVNAGHNAPLVLRCGPDGATEVIRIEADGPVVGLLQFAPYSEQTLTLQAGDLVLMYTDGISEAMTHDDEEWGEDRLVAAADSCKHLSADEIMNKLFADADAFTAGAPQHDDMTLLVLKLE